MKMSSPLITIATLLLALGTLIRPLHAQTVMPLVNPGFEEDLKGWTVAASTPVVASILPEAASLGSKGLRLQTTKECPAFKIQSSAMPVTAGRNYGVAFWSAGAGNNPVEGAIDQAIVKMLFMDASGKEIVPADDRTKRPRPFAGLTGGKAAKSFPMAARAPEGAVSLFLQIECTRREPGGPVDIDDFLVKELSDVPTPPLPPGQGHPIPPFDPERVKALEQDVAANPYRGTTPPKIVIKLDDLKPTKNGKVHPHWLRVAEYAKAKNIKVSFGIITSGMATPDAAEFFQWVKDRNAEGSFEFWNHGWDHGDRVDAATGKKIQEFCGETYEYQKKHMTDSNLLAREKLGFPFVSFGAPFNAVDANTVKVLEEEPDIKVWMYGDAKNPAGKVILARDLIGIEYPTLLPSYSNFLENYAHNRGSGLHTMQGHPGGWGDDRWEQFVKIADFLIAQKAEFLLPRDFADAKDPAKAAPHQP